MAVMSIVLRFFSSLGSTYKEKSYLSHDMTLRSFQKIRARFSVENGACQFSEKIESCNLGKLFSRNVDDNLVLSLLMMLPACITYSTVRC